MEEIMCSTCKSNRPLNQFEFKNDGKRKKICIKCVTRKKKSNKESGNNSYNIQILESLITDNPHNINNIIIQNLLKNPNLINDEMVIKLIQNYNHPLNNITTNTNKDDHAKIIITKIDKIRTKYNNAKILETENQTGFDFFKDDDKKNLVILFENDELHKFIGNKIVNKYEMTKNNKNNQSIYVADKQRKKFIIRCREDNYDVWKEDNGGLIIKSMIIDPIVKQFETYMTDFMVEILNIKKEYENKRSKIKNIKHEDNIDERKDAIFNNDYYLIVRIFAALCLILMGKELENLSNKILNYITNSFNLE